MTAQDRIKLSELAELVARAGTQEVLTLRQRLEYELLGDQYEREHEREWFPPAGN